MNYRFCHFVVSIYACVAGSSQYFCLLISLNWFDEMVYDTDSLSEGGLMLPGTECAGPKPSKICMFVSPRYNQFSWSESSGQVYLIWRPEFLCIRLSHSNYLYARSWLVPACDVFSNAFQLTTQVTCNHFVTFISVILNFWTFNNEGFIKKEGWKMKLLAPVVE